MKPTRLLDTWLIVRVAGIVHCWNLGVPDDARIQDAVDRARVLLGFQVGDNWINDLQRNSIQITCGEPHPNLMAEATVHQLSELDGVTPTALSGYRAQCDTARQTSRLQAVRELLLALTPEERAELYAAIPPRSTGLGGSHG